MDWPSWSESVWTSLIAASISLAISLLAIVSRSIGESRARQRSLFAEAFASCVSYREFPFAIRRRRADKPGDERLRISEALREIQGKLAYYTAWIESESNWVGKHYEEMLKLTRSQAGSQMKEAWNADAANSDSDMNVRGIDMSVYTPSDSRYVVSVRDHLSWWPVWIRRVGRSVLRRVR